ncbi:MAG: ABC transporter substrate-binding protein, partial [Peptostreptococcaceae bacterium]
MRGLKKLTSLALVTMLSVGTLVGCSSTNEKNQGSQEKSEKVEVFKIGTTAPNDVFNATVQGSAYGRMNYNSFSQINFFERNENGEIAPGFIQSWEISEDGKELTLNFPKEGEVLFHDGKPVRAEDVKFSFEYYRDVMNKVWFKKIESLELTSDTQMKVKFDSNYAFSFLNETNLQYYVLGEHIWKDIEDPMNYTGEDASIGAGPYKLTSIDKDAQISNYEAVDNYFKGEQTIEKVVVKSYDTHEALLMAMQNGDIDAMNDYSNGIESTLIGTVENNKEVDMGESLNPAAYHMVFGFNKYPTNDLSFRKAVREALDYDLLSNMINGKYGEVANTGAVSPVNIGHDDSLPKNKQNIEEAKKILDEAGFKDINNDGFRELPDGKEMDVKIAQSGNDLYLRIGEVVINNLESIGIKATMDEKCISNDDYTTELRNKGEYEIYLGMTTVGRAQWTGVVNYVADIMSNKKWGTYADKEYLEAYNGMLYAENYDQYKESLV